MLKHRNYLNIFFDNKHNQKIKSVLKIKIKIPTSLPCSSLLLKNEINESTT